MNALNQISTMQAVLRLVAERKAWEAANPELAAAWDAARREDEERSTRTERERDGSEARRLAHATLEREEFPPKQMRELAAVDRAREHLPKAIAYVAGQLPVFALFGVTGQGKTLAAVWAARELLTRMPLDSMATGQSTTPALFEPATKLSRLGSYNAADREWFERLLRVRVLVLDDLGVEMLGSATAPHIDELIDTRINFCRRTIFTTNLTTTAFKARYGDRIADRLRQSAVISVGAGASLRKAPPK